MSDRSGRQGRGFMVPRAVVRETDTYLGRNDEEKAPEPPNKLIRRLFQPAAVTILVACVTWSVSHTIAPILAAESQGTLSGVPLLWGTSIIMTLIGFYTQRAVRRQFLSRSDAVRAQIIELALLFFVVKLVHHLDETIPELLLIIQEWMQSPLSFFDAESIAAYVIGVSGWLAAGFTARDLDDLTNLIGAGLAPGSEEDDPRYRIVSRFFAGAVVLLFCTAMNRVSMAQFLLMSNERIRAPIANVLLYFLCGVLLLGQVHWLRMTTLWQQQKVSIAEGLGTTWLRYALLFIGLAALVAFVLPTGYTIGILDLVSLAGLVIAYVLTLLYLLLLWPFVALLSLFMHGGKGVTLPDLPPPTFAPSTEIAAAGGNWWAIVRSVLFWVTLLVVVIYLVRSYIRDHPGLIQRLGQITPIRWLTQAWRGFWRWLHRLRGLIPTAMPKLLWRRRGRARKRADTRRVRRLGAREQILRAYTATLERAREVGMGRRSIQTPYEYRGALLPRLEEEQDAMDSLTEAFVAARYSTRNFAPEEAQAQEANARRVQQSLREVHQPGQRPTTPKRQ